jgi:SAM-dependent methyltransferase
VKRVLPTVYASFPTRETRSRFVHERFARYLSGSVLDVGCFEAPLRKLVAPAAYTGVDVAGDPDVTLDLEKAERLPFDDASFECVVCVEVLEHLDSLHRMFDELVRVSRRWIIVSLPNCWADARQPMDRGRGTFAHYGLPAERPEDRHKWFFNLTDAREFLEGGARRLDLDVEQMFVTEKPRSGVVRMLRRLRYPGDRYQNRYSRTIWTVLSRP